jgi:hypothetical protein
VTKNTFFISTFFESNNEVIKIKINPLNLSDFSKESIVVFGE